MRIAGVVVLYNPDSSVLGNIKSYIDKVAALFVVDNSKEINIELFSELKLLSSKIVYISLGDNYGIAKALNVGAENAIKRGYEWLLTMDQDSSFEDSSISKLIDFVSNKDREELDSIGIISPYHKIADDMECPLLDEYEEVEITSASGNLLNLDIYKIIGGFNEDFYLDEVDHEYCYRLKSNNFKVVRLNKSTLKHKLGKSKRYSIFNKSYFVTNHNYVRKYYMTRNRLFLIKKYSYLKNRIIYQIIADIIKIILFEKNKYLKLNMMVVAIKDAINNKGGRINESIKMERRSTKLHN